MSFEAEEQLLQIWTATAVEGEVLVAKQLRKEVAQNTGHQVSDDYLWDLPYRHGWSKRESPTTAYQSSGVQR